MSDIEFPLSTISARRMAGRRAVYVPNHRSFGAFIRSPQMRDVTHDVAQDIAALATSLSPMSTNSDPSESTGLHAEVRAGFKAKRSGGMIRVAGNTRVQVLVENNVEGSALLEFGTRNLPRSRMLARAGSAFGDFHTWRSDA